MTEQLHFPAEWEPQSAVLIAWPHAGTDWAERLGDVEETYVALVAAITRFQDAVICVADDDLREIDAAPLQRRRAQAFHTLRYDDKRIVPAVAHRCGTQRGSRPRNR